MALDDKLSGRIADLTDAVAIQKDMLFEAMEQMRLELQAELVQAREDFQAELAQAKEELQLELVEFASKAQEDLNAAVQHGMEQLEATQLQQKESSDWSDWSLLDVEEFQDLVRRVEALEDGIPGEPPDGAVDPNGDLYDSLVDRVTNLEAGRPHRCG